MITFYRTRNCKACANIQDVLEDMCISHKTIVLASASELPDELDAGGPPPVLVDEHEVVQGRDNILAHLEKLEEFMELWYKFQSDACYCDENGNVE